MKNYIRTCLSLDKETKDKAIDLAMTLGTSMSGAIREAIDFLANHVATWNIEQHEKREKLFGWRK